MPGGAGGGADEDMIFWFRHGLSSQICFCELNVKDSRTLSGLSTEKPGKLIISYRRIMFDYL